MAKQASCDLPACAIHGTMPVARIVQRPHRPGALANMKDL